MVKSIKSVRTRNWSLITYLAPSVLVERLFALDNVRYFAFILHDKDTLEDGTLKDKHIHLALVLNSARTLSQLAPRFTDIYSDAGNCFGQPTRSNLAIVDYFIHKNEPDKYQYSVSDIVSNNLEYFQNEDNIEDNTFLIIEDLLNGKSLREMVKIYGRDFLYHYRDYKLLAVDIRFQEEPPSDLPKS